MAKHFSIRLRPGQPRVVPTKGRPKDENLSDEQMAELFAQFEPNPEPLRSSVLNGFPPTSNDSSPGTQPPKTIERSKKLWEGLGWLGLIAVALLVYAVTGEVNPFLLIIGFAFLVIAPAAYFLSRNGHRKAPNSWSTKGISKRSESSDPVSDSPIVTALKVGFLTALYFCAALVGAVILALVMAGLTLGR